MLDSVPDILTFNECRKVLKIGKNSLLDLLHNNVHIPQNLRIRSEGTERHSALN